METNQRIEWIEEFLFPNGLWKKWEPITSFLTIVLAVLVLSLFFFIPRMLFFSAPKWNSAGLLILTTTAVVVSAYRGLERYLLYRHLKWLKSNQAVETSSGTDELWKAVHKKYRLAGFLIVFLAGLALVQTFAYNGFGTPSGLSFWPYMQWPVCLGLLLTIALLSIRVFRIYRIIKFFERLNP